MKKLTQRQVQHLYWRAGFGISYKDAKQREGRSAEELTEEIFRNSERVEPLNFIEKDKTLPAFKEMSGDERKAALKQLRQLNLKMNAHWLDQMATSKSFFREKMTLFWHGHFACRSRLALFTQNQNNILRENALGHFGDLLLAVSQDPAMLQFLNNQQNKKRSPNENFAREVMELFTLGRGNYSEQDIKEAARAFTGWGFNKEGDFVFRQKQHDYSEKTFFGKKGNFDGTDILNLILNEKQAARFLTQKIYKYFVNEQVDEAIVSQLANDFYLSDYNIEKLMYQIFTSDWFYDEKNMGVKIKSPVEFLAGMIKIFNIEFESPEPIIFVQKILGQILFSPPNVAGWAGGKNWIDSSTLMFRIQLSKYIFTNSEIQLNGKESGDVNALFKGRRQFRKIQGIVDWKPLVKSLNGVSEQNLQEILAEALLQTSPERKLPLTAVSSNQSKEAQIIENVLKITQLPEYQLC